MVRPLTSKREASHVVDRGVGLTARSSSTMA